MEEENVEYDHCGNCQAFFQENSSRIKLITNDRSENDERDRISIYEALSVIFEIPPLNQNDDTEKEVATTKKDIFLAGSVFTLDNGRGQEGEEEGAERVGGSFVICVDCSELLTNLYRYFQNFTKVCKLESEIGQIFKKLKTSSNVEKGMDGGEHTGENKISSFNDVNGRLEVYNVTVKTEQAEESDNERNNNDDHFDDGDYSGGNSPISNSNNDGGKEGENEFTIKLPPAESDEDNNSELGERGRSIQLPRRSERTRRNTTKKSTSGDHVAQEYSDSETDTSISNNRRDRRDGQDSDEDYIPSSKDDENVPVNQKIVTNLQSGRGTIIQFNCPTCSKKFLNQNTLICHRRIIHRENIKMQAPPRLPQIPLTKTQRLQALAESNGKTSACPICRLEVPRTEIRCHLSSHTRSLSKPWLCTICGSNFNSQKDLTEHSRVHVAGIPCKRCGRKIPILNMLHHIRRCMYLGNDLRCKVCKKKFATDEQLTQHQTKAHGQHWRCKLCGIKFFQREKMQKHMLTHKQKKSYKCKICIKSFDRIDVMRLHVKRFHRNNDGPPPSVQKNITLESGECDDDRNFGDDLPHSPVTSPSPPRHNRQYTKKKHSSNSTSNKQSSSAKLEPIVIQENMYSCKGCDFECSSPGNLDEHLLETHTNQECLTCKICDRQLQDSYCLNLHVKTHGQMKPLECFDLSCGKVYRDKSSFYCHLKEKHKMDGKQISERYGDLFRNMDRNYSIRYIKMKYKQQAHTKRGEFPCEICGKVFPFIHAVRNHVKIVHDKVKDYLCKYCGKAFARKSYFLLHEKLHTTNETPYKCHLCNKGFRLPGNLKMHLKSTIHNPNKDFVCEICGKGFNRNDNLRLHVRSVHMKIAVRKPRSEASDRYTHGGRHRVYAAASDDNNDSKAAGISSVEPTPGTSHSFYDHQQQSQLTSSSVDNSTQMTGDISRHSPAESEDHHQQTDTQASSLTVPVLDQQESVQLHQHPPFLQADFHLRGYPYRTQ